MSYGDAYGKLFKDIINGFKLIIIIAVIAIIFAFASGLLIGIYCF